MKTTIGKYDYNLVEENRIIVTHCDGAESPTYRVVMIFVRNGSEIISQGSLMDTDYIEIQSNAIKIFKGEITE